MNWTRHSTPPRHLGRSRPGTWALVALLALVLGLSLAGLQAQESWPDALRRMPLDQPVAELNQNTCLKLMLRSFQSNAVVKALIFMPGATDEFYMFHRARAALTNAAPTEFDAVCALTNQTLIRVTFRPPFLLLHSDEDPIDVLATIEHPATVEQFKQRAFIPHALFINEDWDYVQPILKRTLKVDVQPWRYSQDSWHFWRHSLAAWNLNGWEAVQAVALAGKTIFIIRRDVDLLVPHTRLIYKGDRRIRANVKF